MVCMSFAICGVMTCWSPFRFTFLMACAMQGHCGRKFHTSFTVGNLWQGMGMAFGCQLLLAFPRAKQQLLQWKLQESYSLHTFNVHLSKIFDVSGRHSSWALAGPGSCHVFGHGWTRCKGSSLNTKGIISRNVKPVKPFNLQFCNPWQELNDHAKHLRNIDDRCAPVIGCFANLWSFFPWRLTTTQSLVPKALGKSVNSGNRKR